MERKGSNRGGQFDSDLQRSAQQRGSEEGGSQRKIDEDVSRRATEGTPGGQTGTRQDETIGPGEETTRGTEKGGGTQRTTEEQKRQAGSKSAGESSRSGSTRRGQ